MLCSNLLLLGIAIGLTITVMFLIRSHASVENQNLELAERNDVLRAELALRDPERQFGADQLTAWQNFSRQLENRLAVYGAPLTDKEQWQKLQAILRRGENVLTYATVHYVMELFTVLFDLRDCLDTSTSDYEIDAEGGFRVRPRCHGVAVPVDGADDGVVDLGLPFANEVG